MSDLKRKVKRAFQAALDALEACDEGPNGDIHDELCQAVAHLTIAVSHTKSEAPDEA